MNAVALTKGSLVFLIVTGAWLLGSSLRLGDLHGLVFRLYSLYALLGLALVNLAVTGFTHSSTRRSLLPERSLPPSLL